MGQFLESETNGQLADLTTPQWKFATDTDHRYLAFVSGVGAGKTFAGIARTFANLERWNRGSMGAIIAPARRMIVDVIIPEMRNLGFFDPPFNWTYNSAYSDQPGIHTPHGSRALILSADNKKTIERLRGLNLAWGWIDEESVVNPRAREILNQRLRVGQYRNLYATTTPKGKNHTYEFFAKDVPRNEDWTGPGELYESDSTLCLVGVPTDQNPNLPADYKDAMQDDMPEQIRQQEIQGRFVEVGSGIFKPDDFTKISPEFLQDKPLSFYLGVDVAAVAGDTQARESDSDYWAATLACQPRTSSEAYILDVQRERGFTLREGLAWIQGITDSIDDTVQVYVESNQSQRWAQQELQDRGVQATQIQNTRSKEDRLIEMSIPLERGDIQFVDFGDGRFDELFNELYAFPEGAHDDLADSLEIVTSQVVAGQTTSPLSMDPYGDE